MHLEKSHALVLPPQDVASHQRPCAGLMMACQSIAKYRPHGCTQTITFKKDMRQEALAITLDESFSQHLMSCVAVLCSYLLLRQHVSTSTFELEG